jgi:hypothetical protein
MTTRRRERRERIEWNKHRRWCKREGIRVYDVESIEVRIDGALLPYSGHLSYEFTDEEMRSLLED